MEFKSIHSSSTANLYTLSCEDSMILIEAGLSGKTLKKALNYRLSQLKGCLLSHAHSDHSRGCMDVVRAGVDCYLSKETAEMLNIEEHRVKIIEPLKQFSIDNFNILPFSTEHDCPGSLGFLIENCCNKLVFITDSYYCKYKFKGLTHICIECNWSDDTISENIPECLKQRIYRSHFSLERVLEFMESNDISNVREIHLLHLSYDNSNEEFFKQRIQAATGKPVFVCGK